MKQQILFLQGRSRMVMAHLFLMVAIAVPNSAAFASQQFQGSTPTLVIEAPAQVALGEPIEIQIVIDHAQDLAGYEGQLLFDTSAAHFSAFEQRDSDLKKFGRDVIPLEEGELTDGVTMGLASCPFQDCVQLNGNAQPRGANGRVRLGTVEIGTDQEGLVELRFDHLKFVDSSGNPLTVDVLQSDFYVQVGDNSGVTFAAPSSTWQLSPNARTTANFDVNGDGLVDYADAAEVALEWKLSREQGQPCGPANDLSRDANGDGCIDVSDIQFVLANTNTDTNSPKAFAAGPDAGRSAVITTESSAVTLAVANVFTVNSTSDAADANPGNGICATGAGVCTLRAAISEANRHGGADTILFNIPGSGVQTIQLNSRLPTLSDTSGGTTVEGYSQPGSRSNTNSQVSNARLMIQLRGNGPNAFDAMQITSARNIIHGLAFFNMRRSIWFFGSGAHNNVIAGNFIGTNAAGTFGSTTHVLYAYGIEVESGANHNAIGGTAPSDRNIISGNSRTGLDFNSDGTDYNVAYGNIMGLNPSGTARLENMRHGIDINSGPSYNTIGGTAAGQRNILSGNGQNQNDAFVSGIEISHSTLTSFNNVIGNCIGTDATCNTATSWSFNRHYGVNIQDGANNNVVANNVIGNNPQGGIRLTGSGTAFNWIHDNRVGISANGTAIANPNFGVQIARGATHNVIGGFNIITNSPYGVQILDGASDTNKISQNSIYNNSKLGIDLGPTVGVSQNDNGDGDTGPNQGLNFAVLMSATTTQVTGTACVDSGVPKPCRVEIFIAERKTTDQGGGNYGQGKIFVGAGNTTSNGSFTITISGVTPGQFLTSTVTDANGNTSEFSRNIQVTS